MFPKRFGPLGRVGDFMDRFVEAYNWHHGYSEISLHTAAAVRYVTRGHFENQRLSHFTDSLEQAPRALRTALYAQKAPGWLPPYG